MSINRMSGRPRRHNIGHLLGFMLLGAAALPAVADDIAAGKSKAQSCAACHGTNGIAQMPGVPNLAGQPAMYVAEQLKQFRSGKRSNEIMNVVAKPLSDGEVADLAAWYESIKVSVRGD